MSQHNSDSPKIYSAKIAYGDYVKFELVREYSDRTPTTEVLSGFVVGLFNGNLLVADLDLKSEKIYIVPRHACTEINWEPVDLLTKAIVFVQ